MIRYFCDCCGEEIADSNRIEGSDKGRLMGMLRCKLKPPGEPLQVEVTTALGSSWNGGHFCKYCVIEAVASKDDRPAPDVAPAYKLRESETRYMNLLLDLQRVMDDQPTICNFPEVEQLRARIAGVKASGGPRCPSCNKPRREPGLCYRCAHGVAPCPNASMAGGCPCGYADCTKRPRGVKEDQRG